MGFVSGLTLVVCAETESRIKSLAALDNALGGHEMFSSSRSRAGALVGKIWRVVREWQVAFERAGVSDYDIAKIAPAFRQLDDISTAGTRKLWP